MNDIKMKTILFLTIAIILVTGCEKPDKNSEIDKTATELKKPISDATRLKVIEDWQKFRKEAGESLLQAQEKLEQLDAKRIKKESAEKEKMRRIYNSSNYKLEKLKSKLLRQGIKFRNNIGHYTTEDVLKNESWRTSFNAKLVALHNDLDEGLALNP